MWEASFAFHICIACSLPELLWRSVVERAVRTLPILLLAPGCQGTPYIIQRAEPVRVEALVAQPSVEALDMAILHRPSRLDVHQPNLPVFRPAQHAPRGELRAVVRAYVLRPATLFDQPLQHTRYASAAQAGVGLKRQTLTRVRIHHAEDAHHPPGCQAIHDEVHRPLLVGPDQTRRQRSIPHQMLALPAPNRQPFLQIQPVNTLHVDLVASTLEQDMQPSIAVARLLPSQLHQRLAQLDVAVRARLISIARPLHAQQLAGRAFAQPELDRDERHFFSQTGKLHPFFLLTAFRASRSAI